MTPISSPKLEREPTVENIKQILEKHIMNTGQRLCAEGHNSLTHEMNISMLNKRHCI